MPHPFSRGQHNGRTQAAPRRKVVLVLEDHASVGGLIAGLLRQEGYRAVRAWDPTTEDEQLVDEVVRKPFDIDQMLNAVRKALGDPVVDVQPRHYDAQDYFLHGY